MSTACHYPADVSDAPWEILPLLLLPPQLCDRVRSVKRMHKTDLKVVEHTGKGFHIVKHRRTQGPKKSHELTNA